MLNDLILSAAIAGIIATSNIMQGEIDYKNVQPIYNNKNMKTIEENNKYIYVADTKKEFLFEGEIKEVTDGKCGKIISVISENKNSNFEEIIFNISSNTKFISGTVSDFKEGNKVKIVYGPVMTMSLPPQTSALSIEFSK